MKEQIEKILNNKSACLKGWSETGHPIYDTNSDIAQEITNHVFQFIKWKEKKVDKVDNKYFVIKKQLKWRTIFEDFEFKDIEELYNFWYSNVFSKTKKG
jgi:hypothetical protein